MKIQKLALPVVDKENPEYKQIVYAEVYAPLVLDTHNDYMTAETIENMAHEFLKAKRQGFIDLYHNNTLIDACVVESFIARDNDPDFTPKSWVVGIHIQDSEVWQMILNGELNGLSLEAWATSEEKKVSVILPDEVRGITSTVENHKHEFVAKYDDKGNFIGGITSEVNGHTHTITHATMTDKSLDHNHLFDSVTGFYISEVE